MQLIFFNLNHAKTDQKGIEDFLNFHKQNTSIFCLQEASDISETIIDKILPNFKKITAYKYVTEPDTFHLATYVNHNIPLLDTKILEEDKPFLAPSIFTKFYSNEKPIHLLNFHGLSRPVDKLDCPERLQASKNIIQFYNKLQGLKIIGGDFNLFPETESIKIFVENGYVN